MLSAMLLTPDLVAAIDVIDRSQVSPLPPTSDCEKSGTRRSLSSAGRKLTIVEDGAATTTKCDDNCAATNTTGGWYD